MVIDLIEEVTKIIKEKVVSYVLIICILIKLYEIFYQ